MNQLTDTALSVGGVTEYIKALVEGDRFLQTLWLTGEVSSTGYHTTGTFFTLCDPDCEATLRCVIWRSQRAKVVQHPQQGEQLLVLGSINLYAKRGEYQMTVWQALPGGEGLQALRLQQLKSRLEAEGLFAPERKRPLPAYPQTLAIVTSPKAAAWGDMQRTFQQRAPGLHLLFAPATVQGETAPNSIVTAIENVNRDGRAEVIILARGGGAVEDLTCFNDERVVRAIGQSNIPIVTGIGHQRDESLADLVADFAAHTPTAAAESVTPDYSLLKACHQQRRSRLTLALTQRLRWEVEHLATLNKRFKSLLATAPILNQAVAKCQIFSQKLIALDPQAVLTRGYAIVKLADGSLLRNADNLVPQQELTIQLGQGKLKVKITEILDEKSSKI
ncbi:MAG: exodeoxyribonuclease VII large subunit [Gomphosphaeria aponina SAG 52.96 = DSM 107014]|uniref:Exodeoxyribonuclease 7 large subunit n=1 Tax=Gomphosphaeria aponina SAG 52.96 = DSM 107014 TaxID=1521640 RepID=A0A941JS61_9CHRO|nr:exodeoxyribonuclease VII large subunit [Gomphosphaeria aponina SAG 52.96 = DSM 107014]